jgi:hypothetical protein
VIAGADRPAQRIGQLLDALKESAQLCPNAGTTTEVSGSAMYRPGGHQCAEGIRATALEPGTKALCFLPICPHRRRDCTTMKVRSRDLRWLIKWLGVGQELPYSVLAKDRLGDLIVGVIHLCPSLRCFGEGERRARGFAAACADHAEPRTNPCAVFPVASSGRKQQFVELVLDVGSQRRPGFEVIELNRKACPSLLNRPENLRGALHHIYHRVPVLLG